MFFLSNFCEKNEKIFCWDLVKTSDGFVLDWNNS